MKQGTLIALWVLCLSSFPAWAGTAPYGNIKLTPAERTLLEQHIGKRLRYHESLERRIEFPEVLRLIEYVDDVGPRTKGIIVDGVWIDGSSPHLFWLPEQATGHVLQARGWSTLDGGHAPEATVEGADVVVRMWLVATFTSIRGPRITRDQAPRVLRFKPDGAMIEEKPGAESALQ